jgi:hypothetical protein
MAGCRSKKGRRWPGQSTFPGVPGWRRRTSRFTLAPCHPTRSAAPYSARWGESRIGVRATADAHPVSTPSSPGPPELWGKKKKKQPLRLCNLYSTDTSPLPSHSNHSFIACCVIPCVVVIASLLQPAASSAPSFYDAETTLRLLITNARPSLLSALIASRLMPNQQSLSLRHAASGSSASPSPK